MNVKYQSILLAASGLAVGMTPALAETSQSSLSFACQMNNGVPTTVARATDNDRTLDIFYWKQEALPNSVSADKLCDRVSAKLEDFSNQRGHDIAAINFETSDPGGLPAICATGADDMCTVLFTLSPTEEPIVTANEVLTAILNKNLQAEELKSTSSVRGVQSFSYKVSLLDLLGISSLKFFR
jgi:hypothetical protein